MFTSLENGPYEFAFVIYIFFIIMNYSTCNVTVSVHCLLITLWKYVMVISYELSSIN